MSDNGNKNENIENKANIELNEAEENNNKINEKDEEDNKNIINEKVKDNEEDEKEESNKEKEEEGDKNFNKKRRRENKADPSSKKSQQKRKKEMGHKNDGMCQKFFRNGFCDRNECTYSHDVKTYINSAKYLDEPCQIYKKYGTCPSGFICMWGKDHIDFEKVELKKNEELIGEDIHKLRKGKFEFNMPSEFPNPEPKILDFKDKLILPSLCTFANLPFRKIVKKFGCDITMSEMVMSQSLIEGKSSEWALTRKDPCEDILVYKYVQVKNRRHINQ